MPYYMQIRNALIEQIRQGHYAPGALLPGEEALAERFGVTRMTIRHALGTLRESGYITTDKGRGSRVTGTRIEQSLSRFYSFGRKFRDTGREFSSRVVEARVVDPAPDLVARFVPAGGGNGPAGRFYQIVRLRILEAVPLILERAIIPVSVAPGIIDRDLAAASIYDLLERDYGQAVAGATEYLEPRVALGEDAEILGVAGGSAVFYAERVTRNTAGQVIEVRMSLIRGDKIRFSTELSLSADTLHAYEPGDTPRRRK